MKKYFGYILLLMIFLLSGCGTKTPAPSALPSASDTAPADEGIARPASAAESESHETDTPLDPAGTDEDNDALYDYKRLYAYKNTSLDDSARLGELVSLSQYGRELPVDRIEYIADQNNMLKIRYRMNLSQGQTYHVDHTKQMQDTILLFALLGALDAVEFNLVQEDYGYGGVPTTRGEAERIVGEDILMLSETEQSFLSELPDKIQAVSYNPDVMSDISYEHIMGLDG